jgi:hypothetical protein
MHKTKEKKRSFAIFEKLKEVDIFGVQVEWTIGGNPSFKTYIGAIISILVMALVLAYSISHLVAMVTISNPDIKTSTLKINLSDS